MARKKKIIERIEVADFAAEGKCLTRYEGEVIFINTPNVAPGDVVKLQINRKRNSFSEAIVLERHTASTLRVEPFCQHFGTCGGCKWQHIPYKMQLHQKEKQVVDQLERLGNLKLSNIKPILAAPQTRFYRNKLEFTFSNARWLTTEEIKSTDKVAKDALGFHIPKRFDKVLPIDYCFLQADPSNAIRDFFRDYAHHSGLPFYDHNEHLGFFRNLMIRTSSTGQTMVVVQFAQPDTQEIEKCLAAFTAKFPEIDSVNYFINQKRNDTYQDLEPVCFKGTPYIEEEMEGLRFRIAVKSFYQTNSWQAFRLYEKVREMADIRPEHLVFDLYTGTGTIANFVARQAKKVIGIEYIEDAVKDARVNSAINGIDNTAFFAGNMKDMLTDDFVAKNGKPQIIITDPPRAGMDKEVVEMLMYLRAERIVYVSCNAATQARDIKLMAHLYQVSEVQPVDMFPHTHHVENIVRLDLQLP